MTDDLKKLQMIYEYMDAGLNSSPVSDTKNSYQLTASMSGPNNGPTGGASNADKLGAEDKVLFPKDLSNEDKILLLKKFLQHEIDNGEWDDKTKNTFKDWLKTIL